MAAPNAPTWASTAMVAGDGTLALSVVAGAPSDRIYAVYRTLGKSDVWSAESLTNSVVGTGVINLTGLTNEVAYMVLLYAVSAGGDYSAPSEIAYGTPTDGTAIDGMDQYRVTGIRSRPGVKTKTLMLEKVGHPIIPKEGT